MRKEKILINLLRGLVDLLGDESERNPNFASRLEKLLSSLPESKVSARKTAATKELRQLPDIYVEWSARGEAEFRRWLSDQPIEVLRALIRQHDLDAPRRTTRWKDMKKLSGYIADQLQSRLARGSSFLRNGGTR